MFFGYKIRVGNLRFGGGFYLIIFILRQLAGMVFLSQPDKLNLNS